MKRVGNKTPKYPRSNECNILYNIYIFYNVVFMTYESFRKELTIKWNAIYYMLCQYKQCKCYDVKKKSNT